jgi:hypothetical protein
MQPKELAKAEEDFSDIDLESIVGDVKDEDHLSAKLYSSLKPSKRLERRKDSTRPIGSVLDNQTRRVNSALLRYKLEKLAEYCFPIDSYKLSVKNRCVEKQRETSSSIDINVNFNDAGYTKGRVEFSFGTGFDKRLGGTALFIQELARYIAADTGFTAEHIVKLAYHKTPDLNKLKEGQYKISFEFDKDKTTISFRKDNKYAYLSEREYLDQDFFNFTLAKYSKDGSNAVFERYLHDTKQDVQGTIPSIVRGPDGHMDNVFSTPGCLENYLSIEQGVIN